ncbi:TPA: hypothetical protein HA251_01820 [Candidatus Woesearchaeota archaeon]|nr:hypothetical protein [Candidatus Woesearchaeota archaeon]
MTNTYSLNKERQEIVKLASGHCVDITATRVLIEYNAKNQTSKAGDFRQYMDEHLGALRTLRQEARAYIDHNLRDEVLSVPHRRPELSDENAHHYAEAKLLFDFLWTDHNRYVSIQQWKMSDIIMKRKADGNCTARTAIFNLLGESMGLVTDVRIPQDRAHVLPDLTIGTAKIAVELCEPRGFDTPVQRLAGDRIYDNGYLIYGALVWRQWMLPRLPASQYTKQMQRDDALLALLNSKYNC